MAKKKAKEAAQDAATPAVVVSGFGPPEEAAIVQQGEDPKPVKPTKAPKPSKAPVVRRISPLALSMMPIQTRVDTVEQYLTERHAMEVAILLDTNASGRRIYHLLGTPPTGDAFFIESRYTPEGFLYPMGASERKAAAIASTKAWVFNGDCSRTLTASDGSVAQTSAKLEPSS
jgi:hypothetical protein